MVEVIQGSCLVGYSSGGIRSNSSNITVYHSICLSSNNIQLVFYVFSGVLDKQ
jgi:hypothetical protein